MKKVLWVILLVGVIGCFLWLALFDKNAASRHMIAKVRYFDGSTDTIRISEYSPVGGNGDMNDLRFTFRHLPMTPGGAPVMLSDNE